MKSYFLHELRKYPQELDLGFLLINYKDPCLYRILGRTDLVGILGLSYMSSFDSVLHVHRGDVLDCGTFLHLPSLDCITQISSFP